MAGTRVAFFLLVAGTLCAAAEPLPEIAVSRQLLEARGLELGQVVRLATTPDAAEARSYRIVASYEPIPNPFILTERRLEVRMHLPDLVDLHNPSGDPLAAETVSRVNVKLEEGADPSTVMRALRVRLPPGVESSSPQRHELAKIHSWFSSAFTSRSR